MAAAVNEPAPRIVSPVLLILAGLCFLLPFAGVSCNTSAATAELGSMSSISQQLGGEGSVSMPAGLTGCLNSLNNYNFANYSGLDLAAGSGPTVAGTEPGRCSALSSEEGTSGSIPTSAEANQLGLGAQPLLVVALAAMLFGLLLSLGRFALRGVAVAVVAAVAIVLLVVEQGQMSTQVLDKISQSALGSSSVSGLFGSTGSSPNFISAEMSAYFTITVGIGFILAIVALAVVVLYNLAAELVPLVSGRTRPGTQVAYAGVPVAPPGGGWIGGPSSSGGYAPPAPLPPGGWGPPPLPQPGGYYPPAPPPEAPPPEV